MLKLGISPGKGRGVFAAVPIKAGTVFERCPIIRIPKEEIMHIRRTVLADYFFTWDREKQDAAIALGFGSLYNHSYRPNAKFDMALEDREVVFTALRDIEAGEEITVNYNGKPDDMRRLWFETLP